MPSLSPYFVKLFNTVSPNSPFALELLQAHIAVIPKEGKDPSSCGNYRPISLLNIDLKLFTKILANRIQQHLPHLIHLDQMGFVPTREARDNTTKVLNLLHIINKSQTPCVFLGMDAEKAFDRVNWDFMIAVLRYAGFGDQMTQWISSIYCKPKARVRANGVLSDPFHISNGTRQGCPLSPLLFALSLEPFLCAMRRNPDVVGIKVRNSQHKISAYADDMLFSLTNPVISLPNLFKEIKKYGTLSNLKINFQISEAMGVNLSQILKLQMQTNFLN